jgi:cyclin A
MGLVPNAKIVSHAQVAEEYKLVPDTLYLTVSYIDRFLSSNIVTRQRLQLLGVSCMLIAA